MHDGLRRIDTEQRAVGSELGGVGGPHREDGPVEPACRLIRGARRMVTFILCHDGRIGPAEFGVPAPSKKSREQPPGLLYADGFKAARAR
jgi:hypothetical protein